MKLLKMIARSFAAGIAAALAVNAAWLLVTGHTPTFVTALVASEAVTTLWSIGEAVRWQRRWHRVMADYQRPALGEGIDIPHRPPMDDAA